MFAGLLEGLIDGVTCHQVGDSAKDIAMMHSISLIQTIFPIDGQNWGLQWSIYTNKSNRKRE